MLIARQLLVIGGVLSLTGALIVLFSPTAEAFLSWPWDDETLLVAFLTAAILIAGLLSPLTLLNNPNQRNQAETIPESLPSSPSPGHDLESVLDSRWPASLPVARRKRIHTQLRQAAIRTIVRTAECSAQTAREKIKEGTWTDDPVAISFVRSDPDVNTPYLQLLSKRAWFPRRARRTAQAILLRSEQSDRDNEH